MYATRPNAGFSLLEVVIAMGIFSLVLTGTFLLCRDAASQSSADMLQTHAENQVQEAVDLIVKELKETSPVLRSSYDFTEGGWTQTALVFPTARRRVVAGDPQSEKFVYTDASGNVQSEPCWQGIEVICYAPNPGGSDGGLFKYVDYGAHSYVAPITVVAITASQIRLSDGTVFNRTPRDGPKGALQDRITIQGSFVQVMTQGVDPVQLTIRAQSRNEKMRGMVTTTLTNEALSRNHN